MEAIDFMFGCMGLLLLVAAAFIATATVEEAYNWWNYRR